MVQTDLYFDAENQVIGIRCIDENGAVIDTLPELRLDLEDLQYATEMLAFMRRVHFTDANDATQKRCYGLFTKPEDDETDDGHSSDAEDLHLGGGGGGPRRMRVKSVEGDYLTCRTFTDRVVASAVVNAGGTGYAVGNTLTVAGGTGTAATLRVATVNSGVIQTVSVLTGGLYTADPSTTANAVTGGDGTAATMNLTMGGGEGGADVYAAKPPQLRHSITAQTINAVAVTYDTFAISGGKCTRIAKGSGFANQNEVVLPVWQIAGTALDAEIWADTPVDGTGVLRSGAPVTMMDTNRDARAWCQAN
jgi:hypothetical protein